MATGLWLLIVGSALVASTLGLVTATAVVRPRKEKEVRTFTYDEYDRLVKEEVERVYE